MSKESIKEIHELLKKHSNKHKPLEEIKEVLDFAESLIEEGYDFTNDIVEIFLNDELMEKALMRFGEYFKDQAEEIDKLNHLDNKNKHQLLRNAAESGIKSVLVSLSTSLTKSIAFSMECTFASHGYNNFKEHHDRKRMEESIEKKYTQDDFVKDVRKIIIKLYDAINEAVFEEIKRVNKV